MNAKNLCDHIGCGMIFKMNFGSADGPFSFWSVALYVALFAQ
jgi:hypothetical protein